MAEPTVADARTIQVRPKTEGWQQQKDADGRPLLQFASPKRGKPPTHLADLNPEERRARLVELGLPAFRAQQLARHYFTHSTSDPAEMTDLPAAGRDDLVAGCSRADDRGQAVHHGSW